MIPQLFSLVRNLTLCVIFNTFTVLLNAQSHSIIDSLFSPNPLWQGDTTWMDFTPEGLRTNAPSAGELTWYRPSRAAINGTWQLKTTLEFNPSSSNYAEFHFISGPAGGYFIRFSGHSTDPLSLYLRTPTGDSLLAEIPGYLDQSQPSVDLRIERDSAYTFRIHDGDSLLFTATDSTVRNSQRLAIYCRYTASRVDKFLFSTLVARGEVFFDLRAPELLGIDVLSPMELRLRWSEPCVPAPDFENAVVCGDDTAFYPKLDGRNWWAKYRQPLPLGRHEVWLEGAVDSAGNLAVPEPKEIMLDYAPSRTVHLTAIHPFDGPAPFFLALQSRRVLGPCVLRVLERDGDYRDYLLAGLDTLEVFSGQPMEGATWLPGLKLPKEAVVMVLHEGVVMCMQPYGWHFAAQQELGHHLLYTEAPNYTDAQWTVGLVEHWSAAIHTPVAPPKNRLRELYGEGDEVLLAFEHPLYPYLALGSDSTGGVLALTGDLRWSSQRPFVLETSIGRRFEGLDTTVQVHAIGSGALRLNEVHHSPEVLEEFIELANPASHFEPLSDLILERTPWPLGAAEAKVVPRALPPFCSGCTHVPLVPPAGLVALDPPFSLSADSTQIRLLDPLETELDRMVYGVDTDFPKRSLERISWQTGGSVRMNWATHVPQWSEQTEATPNARNSVAGKAVEGELDLELSKSYLSFDPGMYEPICLLRVVAAPGERLSASLIDGSGRPVCTLFEGVPLSGEDQFEINPTRHLSTNPATGLYFLHIQLDKSPGRSQKTIPLSIYNP
ncbi:MAG: hypothetical protein RL754_895 [Bacteroidota bacterium]